MKSLFFGNTLVFLVVALNNCIFLLLMILFFYHVNGDFQRIFCIVNVFYPLNRGLDTYLCIVSVFYLLNGGLDIRGRELLLGYSPVSTSVNSIQKN